MPFKHPNMIVFRFFIFFIFLFVSIAGQAVLSFGQDGRNAPESEYNVVLIVVNALRSDHLGCYGYFRKTSPNVDSLAKDGVIFDRAIAQSYWTLPSLASLFTSKFVCAHHLDSRDKSLNKENRTLAEILKDRGYATLAFTCGLDTAAVYGLDKGFDVYDAYSGPQPVGSLSDIMPKVLENLKMNKDKKFFLFLQSYDVHPPYVHGAQDSFDQNYKGIFEAMPLDYNTFKKLKGRVFDFGGRKVDITDRDLQHIIARYDDNIRYADSFVGVFINELKALKLYEKTIIILCADHGEELGERGTFNRFGNQNLYQEVIRVPLLIRYPYMSLNSKGKRMEALVGLVDIMPTILDLLGIPSDSLNLQGTSLSGLISTGTNVPVHKFIVSEASRVKWAILEEDGGKLLHSFRQDELYNLIEDSLEINNLIGKKTDMYVSLAKKFFLWREHTKEENKIINHVELSSQLIESLKKAGYW